MSENDQDKTAEQVLSSSRVRLGFARHSSYTKAARAESVVVVPPAFECVHKAARDKLNIKGGSGIRLFLHPDGIELRKNDMGCDIAKILRNDSLIVVSLNGEDFRWAGQSTSSAKDEASHSTTGRDECLTSIATNVHMYVCDSAESERPAGHPMAEAQSPDIAPCDRRALQPAKFQVFCDLDGVLCDFEASALPLCGSKRIPSDRQLWSAIGRYGVRSFFLNLDWMPDGKCLWEYLREVRQQHEVRVLTGLPCGALTKDARRGKEEWCARELGADVQVITCMSKMKSNWCEGANCVLIDDRETLGLAWRKAGGVFIHHVDAERSIARLRQILEANV
jgi:hypothetical protein